jgi:hypothetical protein
MVMDMRRPDETLRFRDEHGLDTCLHVWRERDNKLELAVFVEGESQWWDVLAQRQLVDARDALNAALDPQAPRAMYAVEGVNAEEGAYTIEIECSAEPRDARPVGIEIKRPGDYLWGGRLRRSHAAALRDLLNREIVADLPRVRPRPPATETQPPLPLG